MPREEVRSRLKLTPPRLFDEAIGAAAARGLVVEEAAALRLPDFAITLDPGRQTQIDRYLAALRAAPFTPPAPAEFGIDGELAGALADLALVVFVADGIAYAPEIYDRIVRETLAVIDRDGTIALAGFRDRFGASRKYAQATLEHFDQQRITRRVGDERVRGPAAPARSPAPPSEHA